jgi:hypothetical protein
VVALVVLGVIAVMVFTDLAGTGADNRGKTVRAGQWADDVCGTTGAWRGQLQTIHEELTLNSPGGRRIDTSGDSNVENVYVRVGLKRMISATEHTLQEGIARAGIPDTTGGAQASLALRIWASRTEQSLRAAKSALAHDYASTSLDFNALSVAAATLGHVAAEGRRAFLAVAASDPSLAETLHGSRNCRELLKGAA